MRKRSRERFQEIVRVFVSYGFGYIVDSKLKNHKKSPANLRKAFEELGPTFVKIGQILSTRSDILPEAYIDELIKLQDSAYMESFEDVKMVFESSLNKRLRECFLFFDEEPMASASIAQVHNGILKDGRGVIVKIQRPDVQETMKMDISILKRIVKFTKAKINIEVVDPIEVLNELEASTERELDFIAEGESILIFKKNNKNIASVYAPDIIEELWSSKVLTLENIQGFKINDLKMIRNEGYDNKDIARKLALCYCKQIFDDGFFHGDPHPGNILISNNRICFIDFGITGILDEGLRSWLNIALLSVATGDKKKLVDFILAVGIKRGKIDKGTIYEDVSYLFDTYLATSLKNIKMEILLREIFTLARKNRIQFPRELVVLVRGLVILEGVVAEVDPDLDIISVVTSFAKSKGKFDLLKELNQEQLVLSAYAFARDTIRIPSKTLEVLNTISDGRTRINLNITNLDETISQISNMVNRIVATLLISSLILGSSLIISNKVGPDYKGLSMLGIVGYIISAVFAIILLVSIVKAGHFKAKGKK
ncbi:ABC1 kinase family protein [Clostridium paraputrificum]|uniref:ABC1 kinase family protein n=1 Tax=Clostridium paraputrificum TaxID=29363 RepID=UPI003D32CF78